MITKKKNTIFSKILRELNYDKNSFTNQKNPNTLSAPQSVKSHRDECLQIIVSATPLGREASYWLRNSIIEIVGPSAEKVQGAINK